MALNKVARINDLITTGHGCSAITSIAGSCSPDVFVNDRKMARQGDITEPHTRPVGALCVTHIHRVIKGSTSVFVNNIPVARVNDPADAGTIIKGSDNVYAGG